MNVTADRTSISPATGGRGAETARRGIRTAAGLAVLLAGFSAAPSALGRPAASTSPAARTALAPRAAVSPDCQASLGWQGTCTIAAE